jgi:hypothetical protein
MQTLFKRNDKVYIAGGIAARITSHGEWNNEIGEYTYRIKVTARSERYSHKNWTLYKPHAVHFVRESWLSKR